jgi:hypothetical protein
MRNDYLRYFLLLPLLVIASESTLQELKWIYKIGGVTAEYGNGLAIDSDQNIYDITNFMGNVSVTNNLFFNSKGQEDILIRKSTSLGIMQWTKQIGGKDQDISYDVATDQAKNVYVAGTFRDTLYFGDVSVLHTNREKQASFILKINTDGDLIWAKKFESDVSVGIKTLTFDATNDLVISGSYEGNAVFGQGITAKALGGNDIFIAKMASQDGIINYLKSIGGTDQEYANQHTTDQQGNIYLTGDFRQSIDLDPGIGASNFSSAGLTDIFLLKLTSSGVFIWAKTYGGPGLDSGHSLAVDAGKNVILTGKFSDNISFDNHQKTFQSIGSTDIFLMKTNESGITLWANVYGNSGIDQGAQVITNKNGIIYLGGIFRGNVDFDPSTAFFNGNESNGGADIFVAMYNQDGSYNDHFAFGGQANEQINDVALRNNGQIISTGGYGAIVDFDPTINQINIISTGGLDAFMISIFACVNPYIKTLTAVRPEVCYGENILLQITEGYLNDATQWSWQKDNCDNITFASGTFLNIPISKNTTFYVKGYGGCVVSDPCKKIETRVFRDTLKYNLFKICQGDIVKIGKHEYSTSGVYTDSLKSSSGCDSVLISEIEVYPSYTSTRKVNICPGDTVKVGNSAYTFSGSFTNKFTTNKGCDSTIVTNVNVLPITIENVFSNICKGDSLVIADKIYKHAGTYIQTKKASNGCEDLVIINLKVYNTDTLIRQTICLGDSIKIGSKSYTTSGIFRDTLTASTGCDSLITTNLTVKPSSRSQLFHTICAGDSIIIGKNIYKTSGNYIDYLTNSVGCDSVVYTGLTVLNKPETVTNRKSLCEGDSIKIGNKIYKSTGLYKDTLKTINGCDSLAQYDIQVFQKDHVFNYDICKGDSLKVANNIYFNTGRYIIKNKNNLGCDSNLIVNLTVKEKIIVTPEYRICPGDSLKIGSRTYKTAGTYYDTLQAKNGCDSIIISKIIWNHTLVSHNFSICKGANFVFNGKTYKDAGVYSDTLKQKNGCDSIVTVNIKVNPVYSIDTVYEICKGNNLTIGTTTYFNPGKYSDVLTSAQGCDSTVRFEIKIVNFLPAVIANKDTLKVLAVNGATYQWYECINSEKVPLLGAETPSFPVFKSGKYSVGMTYKGCTYYSECAEFIRSDVYDDAINAVKVYPNPFNSNIIIQTEADAALQIKDLNGKVTSEYILKSGINELDLQHLPQSIYLFEIINQYSKKYVKVSKL